MSEAVCSAACVWNESSPLCVWASELHDLGRRDCADLSGRPIGLVGVRADPDSDVANVCEPGRRLRAHELSGGGLLQCGLVAAGLHQDLLDHAFCGDGRCGECLVRLFDGSGSRSRRPSFADCCTRRSMSRSARARAS